MDTSIDDTDFAIIKCIRDGGKPLWKNKIHECIREQSDQLPIRSAVSVQTVGRRVDDLTEEGLLESCIVSPDEIKRDLIIAFKLTDEGRNALYRKTEEYLQNVVQSTLFGAEDMSHIGKPALLELMEDRFDMNQQMRDRMETEYSRDELITLLTLYYVKQEVSGIFTEENAEKFVDLTENNTAVSEALQRYLMRDKSA